MGVGRAWKERRMVTIRRRKMERDMRREMAVKHKKRSFFFFIYGERNVWEWVWLGVVSHGVEFDILGGF